MYKVFGVVLALCLFREMVAYCCFRDVYTLPCGCSDIETSGIFYVPGCCGVASSCFRDVSNVCVTCDNPSPVCSCLKSVEGCGCGKKVGCDCGKVGCGRKAGCGCGGGAMVYFPEVEYPVVAVEMKPFYYGSCFSV